MVGDSPTGPVATGLERFAGARNRGIMAAGCGFDCGRRRHVQMKDETMTILAWVASIGVVLYVAIRMRSTAKVAQVQTGTALTAVSNSPQSSGDTTDSSALANSIVFRPAQPAVEVAAQQNSITGYLRQTPAQFGNTGIIHAAPPANTGVPSSAAGNSDHVVLTAAVVAKSYPGLKFPTDADPYDIPWYQPSTHQVHYTKRYVVLGKTQYLPATFYFNPGAG